MKKLVKKLFGGIDLTWPKLIIAAVIAGVFTAAMAILPAVRYTSFHAITVTFEVWVLFGIIIIMNSKSNMDSALKCFVFFLISQPLVYLIQVPFSWQGWGLFGYYKYWFIWTVLCLPMGYIGYYMKKGKWWGYLILFPMVVLTASSYITYLKDFMFSRPNYILISLFCACAMILYPLAVFEDKRIRTVGAVIGAMIVIAATGLCIMRPPVYDTVLMVSSDETVFDGSYTASLGDDKYGEVAIEYSEVLESYQVHAKLKHSGDTVLTLTSPSGDKTEYGIHIERDTYRITKK